MDRREPPGQPPCRDNAATTTRPRIPPDRGKRWPARRASNSRPAVPKTPSRSRCGRPQYLHPSPHQARGSRLPPPPPHFAVHSEDYVTAQGFVAAGLGVSLIPRPGLRSPHPDVAVRPSRTPHPPHRPACTPPTVRKAQADNGEENGLVRRWSRPPGTICPCQAATGQGDGERGAACLGDDMVLRAGPGAVDRARPGSGPPRLALVVQWQPAVMARTPLPDRQQTARSAPAGHPAPSTQDRSPSPRTPSTSRPGREYGRDQAFH